MLDIPCRQGLALVVSTSQSELLAASTSRGLFLSQISNSMHIYFALLSLLGMDCLFLTYALGFFDSRPENPILKSNFLVSST